MGDTLRALALVEYLKTLDAKSKKARRVKIEIEKELGL